MQQIQRVALFRSKRDAAVLFVLFILLFSLNLLREYYSYKELLKEPSSTTHATLLKQYTKTKNSKRYTVLKLKSAQGYTFNTTAPPNAPDYKDKELFIRLYPSASLSFYAFLKTFFTSSYIIDAKPLESFKNSVAKELEKLHKDANVAAIYKALFLAEPLPYQLQKQFGALGISHLLAISGFHLGVLGGILFLLFRPPLKLLHTHFFPYRNINHSLFFLSTLILFAYMLFIDSPPSLLRAFVMLLVGFVLYERGVEVFSMQTLLVSALLIVALWPRLLFSLGLFLSLAGVFYIFLFLLYFQHKSRLFGFFMLPIFLYITMLPLSLVIFGTFSLLHPLSIFATLLFGIFYPLSIFVHTIAEADLLDGLLIWLLKLQPHALHIELPWQTLLLEFLLSLLAIFTRAAFVLLLLFCLSLFIYAIYNVT